MNDKLLELNELNLPQIVSILKDLPLQPEEEIKKMTIPEDLSEYERTKLLLSKKDTVQRSYVFKSCESLFSSDIKIQKEILPIILVRRSILRSRKKWGSGAQSYKSKEEKQSRNSFIWMYGFYLTGLDNPRRVLHSDKERGPLYAEGLGRSSVEEVDSSVLLAFTQIVEVSS